MKLFIIFNIKTLVKIRETYNAPNSNEIDDNEDFCTYLEYKKMSKKKLIK